MRKIGLTIRKTTFIACAVALVAFGAVACYSAGVSSTSPETNAAISVGEPAPEFTLPSVSHGEISLGQLTGESPVVVVFYRAYWCPPCRKQLDEIGSDYQKFRDAGVEVVAISTDNLGPTRQLVERNGYEFPILYTAGNAAIPISYDRFNKFGDGLASAAVFIVGTDGRIVWDELGTGIYHFVSSDTILNQLENL